MSYTEKIWNAFSSMIKLEDKVSRQGDNIRKQQDKIENLTERVIRLETQLDMLMNAAVVKKISRKS
jgi:CII-binding regulator of phage lambda lysogenization HflD